MPIQPHSVLNMFNMQDDICRSKFNKRKSKLQNLTPPRHFFCKFVCGQQTVESTFKDFKPLHQSVESRKELHCQVFCRGKSTNICLNLIEDMHNLKELGKWKTSDQMLIKNAQQRSKFQSKYRQPTGVHCLKKPKVLDLSL